MSPRSRPSSAARSTSSPTSVTPSRSKRPCRGASTCSRSSTARTPDTLGAVAGNALGERFRVTSFGESHGGAVGVVVDGCPAGHPFPHARIAAQLARRRPGQPLTSARREADAIEVLS
ncbi:MAG: chorismate synthase, partial [Myxococcales bacterium]|nr:chorismate synthase [Myxococcales bacterium]